MASTTLMTFLLCTGPNVKSVKLLGSWDNFSKPYSMERDKRVGSGHWRGCHSFTDIICDGLPKHMATSRSGGLKMGGTYWYYYLLDDDMEYYNKSEPATSHCPFMPGQPVNVLHVPIILPDARPTHTRERSVGTPQKPDQRTMNPEDKYMNPRRPPKPRLPRLRTSPPLLQQPTPAWSFSTSPLGVITNKSSSQPSSATPRKAPSSKPARSVSPPRSRGLRAAFRQWNASSPDLSVSNDSWPNTASSHGEDLGNEMAHSRSGSAQAILTSHAQESRSTDELTSHRPVSPGGLDPMPLSIQDRRALNATSMEHTPVRNPLTLKTSNPETVVTNKEDSFKSHFHPNQKPSQDSYPFLGTPTVAMPLEDASTPTPFTFMEKRLPTLPNTPSSVMDEALRDLDDRERALDTENLGSHFSDFSATEDSIASDSPFERSHFSEWSEGTDIISPQSMFSPSTFSDLQIPDRLEVPELWDPSVNTEPSDQGTPHLTGNAKPSPITDTSNSPRFELPQPHLSIQLSPSDLDIPGLCIDDVDHVESNPKRHAAFFGAMNSIEALGLSKSPDPSAVHFPEDVHSDMGLARDQKSPEVEDHDRSSKASFRQSATMQEMMDELSYLRNMIQAGASEDI